MRKTAAPALALVVALLAALGLAGCGDPEDAATATSTTTTSLETTTTAGLSGSEHEACEVEVRTIETALFAHQAATGELPTSLSDLAPDWLKEAPSEEWKLTVDGDDYELSGPCPIPERPSVTTIKGTDPLPG